MIAQVAPVAAEPTGSVPAKTATAAKPTATAQAKTEAPVPSACNRETFRVVVDVGHTAGNPGAKSARGVYEYDFNLKLATLIEQKLRQAGFAKTVLLITTDNKRRALVRTGSAGARHGGRPVSLHPPRLGA